MTVEQYTCELESLIEDAGLEVKTSTIKRLANRAKELESEVDFTEEDIYDELFDACDVKLQEDDAGADLIAVFSEFVIAEQDSDGGYDASDEELD